MFVRRKINSRGFSLVEVLVATGIFALFAAGIYSAMVYVDKIVYQSRMSILETAVLSEELEIARNLPYESIGIVNGVPSGVLQRTKTVNRDGALFSIITTVRNIDDSFDGTTGGSPNDLSPADYKLVEMSAQCVSCLQQAPIVLSTVVGPKGLEGSTKNGALFIQVFDANGQPVVGANVHVQNNDVNPKISLDDVTDSSGYLHIIDTATSTGGYSIFVTKSGYSSDYTVTTTASIPNPIKPRANVVSQQITDISFAIDKLANLTVHTMKQDCSAVGNIGFTMKGAKMLGTGPDVYKFNNTYTTNGSGDKVFTNIEWDLYSFALTGAVYDIAGTIPLVPMNLVPDSTDDLTIILKSHSTNSLLVQVADSGTNLPLSNVSARLTGSGYDKTLITGLGYTRQTDWSTGSGVTSSVEGKYFADDGNVSATASAGDILLKKIGQNYQLNGWLESATFDLGTTVNFNNIIFNPLTQPAQTGSRPVLIQIATSNSSSPAIWTYTGPDGTSATYYSPTSTLVAAASSGKRYMRYKVYLHTDNNKYTPTFSEFAITYTDTCTPPGQAFFDSLSATTYTLVLTANGYDSSTTSIDVVTSTQVLIPMPQTP